MIPYKIACREEFIFSKFYWGKLRVTFPSFTTTITANEDRNGESRNYNNEAWAGSVLLEMREKEAKWYDPKGKIGT